MLIISQYLNNLQLIYIINAGAGKVKKKSRRCLYTKHFDIIYNKKGSDTVAEGNHEIDWVAVKTEYVTSKISLLKLSEKHNINYHGLRMRANKEKWSAARDKYREKTYNKSISKISTQESSKLANLMVSTDKLLNKIARTLEDDKQFNRQLVKRVKRSGDTSDEWIEEQVFNKVDTKAINDLTRSLRDLSTIARELYNLPTPAEREAQRIAAERLKLDQQKAEQGLPDGEIVVRFADGADEEYSK